MEKGCQGTRLAFGALVICSLVYLSWISEIGPFHPHNAVCTHLARLQPLRVQLVLHPSVINQTTQQTKPADNTETPTVPSATDASRQQLQSAPGIDQAKPGPTPVRLPRWAPAVAPNGKTFASKLPQQECDKAIVNQLVLPPHVFTRVNTTRDATDTDKDKNVAARINRGKTMFLNSSPMYRCRQPRYGVIVKGKMKKMNELENTLRFYLRHNFNVLFLYSGFNNGSNTQYEPLFQLAKQNPCFRVLLSTPPCDPGSGNYLVQKIAISQGLYEMKKLGVKWVAHTRGDQVLTMHDFMAFMEHLIHATPPLPSYVTDQRYRLISSTRTHISTHKVGFCHLDDQFMFGHIGDMIEYWGVLPQNAYLNVAIRVPTCVQDIPGFTALDWGYGVPPPEVINCQQWLRFKDIRYDNMRRLIDERLIVLRDPFFRRVWNHHENFSPSATGVSLDDLCLDMSDKNEFRPNPTDPCVSFELDSSNFDLMTACDVDIFTYNCSHARAQSGLTGDLILENFYERPCDKPKYWMPF